MQFFTTLTLSTLFLGAFSAPVVEKRQSTSAIASALDSLFTDITQYTGSINSTAASVSTTSPDADQAAARTSFQSDVNSISSAINDAIPTIQALPAETGSVDSTNAVATAYAQIFAEINGALNAFDATGLDNSLVKRQIIVITPLTTSLSQLITALQAVVDNLLAVVKELLDGILTGINNALLGITL
ncbi:MAG: hypothetical protein M1820_000674 [Bogoriella megaspora]|nr:MAG: hypothetical protein M1820_000674 [Bogoriella megaspora]